jgi:hypothetical protein
MFDQSPARYLLAFVLVLAAGLARADCVLDPRSIKLSGDTVVQLRSYTCSDGQTPQFKIEFHRFADVPAGLLMAKASSTLLAKTIGSPRLLENEVSKAYADILKQFGWTQETPKKDDDSFPTRTTISLEGGSSGEDRITAAKVRTLQGLYTQHEAWFYPAATEIKALRKKSIPGGLNYSYSVACEGEAGPPSGEALCKSNDNVRITQNFWRPMRAADVSDYPKNVAAFNALLKEAKKDTMTGPTPRDLNLAQYFAGSQWPDDFLILVGNEHAGACGDDDPGIFGWEFEYWPRDVVLEAVIIENISKQPLKIGTLYGERTAQPRLRAARSAAPMSAGTALGDISQTLAPRGRMLYPTRIGLPVNERLKGIFDNARAATQAQARLGTNGFTGNAAAPRSPAFNDYVFGSELEVTGALVNGRRVDFALAGANFIDLTVAALIGSCPYLLSWDERDHEWVDAGKMLHKATDKDREYSETARFPGLRSRFRLEEREPEVAYIDHAELAIDLKSGKTLTLRVVHPQLGARDGNYLQLYWGDVLDFEFELTVGVAAEDVVESRLTLTGYYQRYSNLMAKENATAPAMPIAVRSASVSRPASPLNMCPTPPASERAAR